MQSVAGKRVLVTGATSGIGQATAVHLASLGASVAVNYREDPASGAETHEQMHDAVRRTGVEGTRHLLVGGDVSVEADAVRMVAETVAGLGGLDLLVNNAGIQLERPSEELSASDFDSVVAVDLRGAFLCAREAIRHFLSVEAGEDPDLGGPAPRGSIVNVSSVHEVIPKPGFLGYSVSKGGMGNLTRTLALEFAGRGIRVNGLAPGATVTPINSEWVDDPEKREQVAQHIPMARAGTAHEMAQVVAFLASDAAAYMTGQTLFVDGGLTLYPSFETDWSS